MARSHNRVDVVLKGRRTYSYVAGAAVLPGCLIELQADGKYDELVSSAAEAIKGEIIIAMADNLSGDSLDQAYALDDVMQACHPVPGDEINLLVKSGETIAIGDNLIPETTTGLWVEAAGTEAHYPFVALETLTPSGNEFILCRKT